MSQLPVSNTPGVTTASSNGYSGVTTMKRLVNAVTAASSSDQKSGFGNTNFSAGMIGLQTVAETALQIQVAATLVIPVAPDPPQLSIFSVDETSMIVTITDPQYAPTNQYWYYLSCMPEYGNNTAQTSNYITAAEEAITLSNLDSNMRYMLSARLVDLASELTSTSSAVLSTYTRPAKPNIDIQSTNVGEVTVTVLPTDKNTSGLIYTIFYGDDEGVLRTLNPVTVFRNLVQGSTFYAVANVENPMSRRISEPSDINSTVVMRLNAPTNLQIVSATSSSLEFYVLATDEDLAKNGIFYNVYCDSAQYSETVSTFGCPYPTVLVSGLAPNTPHQIVATLGFRENISPLFQHPIEEYTRPATPMLAILSRSGDTMKIAFRNAIATNGADCTYTIMYSRISSADSNTIEESLIISDQSLEADTTENGFDSFLLSGLRAANVYSIQAKAVSTLGTGLTSEWSETIRSSIVVPYAPSVTVLNRTATTMVVSISAADTTGDHAAAFYSLKCVREVDAVEIFRIDHQSQNIITIDGLASNISYTISAKVTNSSGIESPESTPMTGIYTLPYTPTLSISNRTSTSLTMVVNSDDAAENKIAEYILSIAVSNTSTPAFIKYTAAAIQTAGGVFTVTGLLPNTSYKMNIATRSSYSGLLSAACPDLTGIYTLPITPNLSIAASPPRTATTLTLSVSLPSTLPSVVGIMPSYYEIYYRPTTLENNNNTNEQIVRITTTGAITLKNLTPNRAYNIYTKSGSATSGLFSDSSSILQNVYTLPAAPTIEVSGRTDTSLTLQIRDSTNSLSEIRYHIYYGNGLFIMGQTTREILISGLTANRGYDIYTVTESRLSGLLSTVSNLLRTQFTLPAAPTCAVSSRTATTMAIAVTPAAGDATITSTRYNAFYTSGSGVSGSLLLQKSNIITFTGLATNQIYNFYTTVTNATWKLSSSSSPLISGEYTPPGPPTVLVTERGPTSLTVSISTTDAIAPDKYNLYCLENNNADAQEIALLNQTSREGLTLTNLKANASYRIWATTTFTLSGYHSASSPILLNEYTKPATPSVSVIERTTTSMVIFISTTDTATPSYANVYYGDKSLLRQTWNGGRQTITGLQGNTAYPIYVTTTSSLSKLSSAVSPVLAAEYTRPTAPYSIQVVGRTNTSLLLQVNTSDSPAPDTYKVYYRASEAAVTDSYLVTAAATGNGRVTITGLETATAYDFYATAYNSTAGLESTASPLTQNVFTQDLMPTLSLVARMATGLSVNITGMSSAQSYYYHVAAGGYLWPPRNGSSGESILLSGLAPNTPYQLDSAVSLIAAPDETIFVTDLFSISAIPSNTLTAVYTLPAAPTVSMVDAERTPTSLSALIQLDPMEQQDTDVYYNLYLQQTTPPPADPAAAAAPIRQIEYALSPSIPMSNLLSNAEYEIWSTLRGKTSGLESESSVHLTHIWTPPASPILESVYAREANLLGVTVSLLTPATDAVPPDGFYAWYSRKNTNNWLRTDMSSTELISIAALEPNCAYQIYVTSYSTASQLESPPSNFFNDIWTLPATPSIEIIARTTDSLVIRIQTTDTATNAFRYNLYYGISGQESTAWSIEKQLSPEITLSGLSAEYRYNVSAKITSLDSGLISAASATQSLAVLSTVTVFAATVEATESSVVIMVYYTTTPLSLVMTDVLYNITNNTINASISGNSSDTFSIANLASNTLYQFTPSLSNNQIATGEVIQVSQSMQAYTLPATPTAIRVTVQTDKQLSFEVDAPDDNVEYLIYTNILGTETPAGTGSVISTGARTGSVSIVSGLTSNTGYTISARARSTLSFLTSSPFTYSSFVYTCPATPTLSSSATPVSLTSIAVTFSSPEDARPRYYIVYWSRDEGITVANNAYENITSASYTITGLSMDTSYTIWGVTRDQESGLASASSPSIVCSTKATLYYDGKNITNQGTETSATLVYTGAVVLNTTYYSNLTTASSYYIPANAYISTPAFPITNSTGNCKFSVSMWWRTNTLTNFGTVFSLGPDSTNCFYVRYNNNGDYRLYLDIGGVTVFSNLYFMKGIVNTWYHLVFTVVYSGTNLMIQSYFNGAGSTNWVNMTTSSQIFSGNSFIIAAMNQRTGASESGSSIYVGDFRFYNNYVVTDAEAAEFYVASLRKFTPTNLSFNSLRTTNSLGFTISSPPGLTATSFTIGSRSDALTAIPTGNPPIKQLWLDASIMSSVITTAGTNIITQWNDLSGFGRNMTLFGGAATYSKACIYDGLVAPGVCVREGGFSGTIPSGTFTNGMTVFIVYAKSFSDRLFKEALFSRTSTLYANPLMVNNNTRYLGQGGNHTTLTSNYTINTICSFTVFTVVANATTYKEYANGELVYSSTNMTTSWADTTTAFYLGTRSDKGVWFSGTYAEVIVYNTYVSDGFREQTQHYLANKWNIALMTMTNTTSPITLYNLISDQPHKAVAKVTLGTGLTSVLGPPLETAVYTIPAAPVLSVSYATSTSSTVIVTNPNCSAINYTMIWSGVSGNGSDTGTIAGIGMITKTFTNLPFNSDSATVNVYFTSIGSGFNSTTSTIFATTKPKLWYQFDDSVNNSGYDLTPAGIGGFTLMVPSNCYISSAQYATGSSSLYNTGTSPYCYLRYNGTITASPNGFTVCFWTYLTTNTAGMFFTMVTSTATNRTFIYNNAGALRICSYSGNGTDIAGFWTTNEWIHLAVTFAPNNTILVYKNGTLTNTITSLVYDSASTYAYVIVSGDWMSGSYYPAIQGYMDDFRYYESVLTATEVSSIFSSAATNTVSTRKLVNQTPFGNRNLGTTDTYSLTNQWANYIFDIYTFSPPAYSYGDYLFNISSNQSTAGINPVRKLSNEVSIKWRCSGTAYTAIGFPTKAVVTTLQNGEAIFGEWWQFKLPYYINIHNYRVLCGDNDRFVGHRLLASYDATNWVSIADPNMTSVNTVQVFTAYTSSYYRYYRMVFTYANTVMGALSFFTMTGTVFQPSIHLYSRENAASVVVYILHPDPYATYNVIYYQDGNINTQTTIASATNQITLSGLSNTTTYTILGQAVVTGVATNVFNTLYNISTTTETPVLIVTDATATTITLQFTNCIEKYANYYNVYWSWSGGNGTSLQNVSDTITITSLSPSTTYTIYGTVTNRGTGITTAASDNLIFTTPTDFYSIISPDSLICAYNFDADSVNVLNVANMATGTAVYDATMPAVNYVNSTYKVNGTGCLQGSYLTINKNITFTTNGVSFTYWQRLTNGLSGGGVTFAWNTNQYCYYTANATTTSMSIYDSIKTVTLPVIPAINDGNFHHHAFIITFLTYDVSKLDYYFDGRWIGSYSVLYPPNQLYASGHNFVNAARWQPGVTYNGYMDCVRVYNRSITPDEVNTLYSQEFLYPYAPTLSIHNFTDTTIEIKASVSYAATSYNFYCNELSLLNQTSNYVTFTGLTPGTTYSIYATANIGFRTSPVSNTLSQQTSNLTPFLYFDGTTTANSGTSTTTYTLTPNGTPSIILNSYYIPNRATFYSIPAITLSNNYRYSVSFYVKYNTINNFDGIFNLGASTSATTSLYTYIYGQLYLNNSAVSFQNPVGTIQTNNWYHIVYTYYDNRTTSSNLTQTYYINGYPFTPIVTTTTAYPFRNTSIVSPLLYLGKNADGNASADSPKYIREFKLYNDYVLTKNDVNMLFKMTLDWLSPSALESIRGAYAVKQIYKKYTGPIFRICRSTDNAQNDFYDDGLGNLFAGPNSTTASGTSLTTWISTATAYVVVWYDQSGKGKHATATSTTSIYYDRTAKCITFAGNAYFTLPDSTIPTGNSSYTLTIKHGTVSSANGGFLGGGTYGAAGQCNAFRTESGSTYKNYWWAADFIAGTVAANNVVSFQYDNTNGGTYGSRYLYTNGSLAATQTPTMYPNVGTTNNTIGTTNNASENYTGQLFFVYISNTCLSQNDRITLEST